MKKKFFKKLCMVMTLVLSGTIFAGCNRELKVTFENKASDYVKLENYKGLQVTIDIATIENNLINNKVQSDLDSVTEYLETSLPSREGDQIRLSFKGRVGGQPIEGFSSDEYSIILGKDTFVIPGFVEELYGLKKDETKIITLEVPENIPDAEEYAGKRIVYDIIVLSVANPVIPHVTDAYAKKYFNYDTLEAYRQGLKNDLQTTIDAEVNAAKQKAIMETLHDTVEILGYPEKALADMEAALDKSIKFYSMMRNLSNDEYCLSIYNMDFDTFVKKSLVQDLIIQLVVEKENLTIDEYYYKANLDEFAKRQGGGDSASFVEKYGKDHIVKNMLLEKAENFIMENNHFE